MVSEIIHPCCQIFYNLVSFFHSKGETIFIVILFLLREHKVPTHIMIIVRTLWIQGNGLRISSETQVRCLIHHRRIILFDNDTSMDTCMYTCYLLMRPGMDCIHVYLTRRDSRLSRYHFAGELCN